MGRCDRVTTGTGDSGTTSLADGTRISKNSIRVCAYGSVDELNSMLGIVLLQPLPDGMEGLLRRIQNELFDLGTDLATPAGRETPVKRRMGDSQVKALEEMIDECSAGLEPLRGFILPGGRPAAAWLHLARTVARRAERSVAELMQSTQEDCNPFCLTYLNRLSDLCFVLARRVNDDGREDVHWRPTQTSQPPQT